MGSHQFSVDATNSIVGHLMCVGPCMFSSCDLLVLLFLCFFFFFSSRRRHTRFKCDWSSDVCSSDLAWAAVLFLVLYNSVHFWLRIRLYWLGLTSGDRLVEAVKIANLPKRGARLRAVGAASAGALAAWLEIGRASGRGRG